MKHLILIASLLLLGLASEARQFNEQPLKLVVWVLDGNNFASPRNEVLNATDLKLRTSNDGQYCKIVSAQSEYDCDYNGYNSDQVRVGVPEFLKLIANESESCDLTDTACTILKSQINSLFGDSHVSFDLTDNYPTTGSMWLKGSNSMFLEYRFTIPEIND